MELDRVDNRLILGQLQKNFNLLKENQCHALRLISSVATTDYYAVGCLAFNDVPFAVTQKKLSFPQNISGYLRDPGGDENPAAPPPLYSCF
jgi:hypothetical protein